MPVYTIDLACRSSSHDYSGLFASLRSAKAQPFMEGRWLIDVQEDVDLVTKALLGCCAAGDGLFVTELAPETRWSGTGLGDEAKLWLLARLREASPPKVPLTPTSLAAGLN